ncbi:MAG: HNH endonuclease [Bacteroidales bacterium]|nr:HNH endonuclease [Bacteroidales bacterium]
MAFSEEIKKEVWAKARTIEGFDPDMFRLDACGALIMYVRYGMINPYGWEIDHVFPQSLGGKDDIDNLRAMHYLNNKSKGEDYPSYIASTRYNGKNNVQDMRSLTVNGRMRARLKELYKNA